MEWENINNVIQSANRHRAAGEDYSEDIVVQQGTGGVSRLVLAFTGPAWSPGPTSVGL